MWKFSHIKLIQLRALPVVSRVLDEARNTGAAYFISKPIVREVLLSILVDEPCDVFDTSTSLG